MNKIILPVIVSILILSISFTAENAFAVFQIDDLGEDGTSSVARAINSAGKIVGNTGHFTTPTPVMFKNGNAVSLGTLGGSFGQANGINNQGQIAGKSDTAFGESHATLWNQNQIVDLGTLGGTSSEANDINSFGVVVGTSNVAGPNTNHAFIWDSVNGMQDLGTLGGPRSTALAINDDGTIVGWAHTTTGQLHAFIWDSVNGMQDLGTLGGSRSVAFDINNNGQTVGWSDTTSGQVVATLWDSGNAISLGTIGGDISIAQAINDKGVVVGRSETAPGNFVFHAFVWDSDNGIQALETLGGNSSTGLDVNNSGKIVGLAALLTGESHATLWQSNAGIDQACSSIDKPNQGKPVGKEIAKQNIGC